MPAEIHLVKVGMTMHEGTVEEWYAGDGERVEAGALLYRLETEKVNLDVDAESAGIVKHLVAAGTTLEPGDVVGYLYADGEAIPNVLPTPDAGDASDASAARSPRDSDASAARSPRDSAGAESLTHPGESLTASGESLTASGESPTASGESLTAPGESPTAPGERKARIAASPVARKLAAERNVDLATVTGTGPRGRITREDVQKARPRRHSDANASATRSPRDSAGAESLTLPGESLTAPGERTARGAAPASRTLPLSAMRRTIAGRMHASLRDAAQLTMDMEVRMDDATKLRRDLLAEWAPEDIRVTYTDLVLIAAGKALTRHPAMNAAWTEGAITRFEAAHVGLAVALDEGLIVPVVRDVGSKSLKQIARESAGLAQRARQGKLGIADVEGGTFTVTSLGMYGVDTFTPILNPPQAGILGVGRIYDGVRWEGEKAVKTASMRLSLTWDHRVLDGVPAAEFLATVRDCLEAPFRLLA